ncbi:putative Phosphatidylinositol-4-phosphate 5-kinase [Spironucleus salmonicida]|uniref:Phosphatidylinositol-4-phosphate 5-kinase n=1 Tax=Spironucleus salmonicida TaxID=348837 RepID=V6LT86_9EUKA|nr:putative Phosphatidylinositol-4-phosphate 5-kinase [Spironucleus salmonicida]|eukprot:EST47790.1 hypothetical protein SS50377_12190 [Spironucleus salmonicida]
MAQIDPEFGAIRAIYSPDGSAYKGTWLKALRHGRGTHVYPQGDVYSGEWRSNQPCGWGCLYTRIEPILPADKKQIPEFPDDDTTLILTYAGNWDKGQRQGFGRYFYSEKQFYVGYWHKRLREGAGCMFYAPEVDRESILYQDQTCTQTVVRITQKSKIEHFTTDLGSLYIGAFSRDFREGPGRVIFGNGDIFVGEFLDGAAQGPGITYYVQKHIKSQGFYDQGHCTSSQSSQEWITEDYNLICQTWAHPCGGYANLSISCFKFLQKYFQTETANYNEYFVDERFYNDETKYPYSLRPDRDFSAQSIPQLEGIEDVVQLAQYLPIKMQEQISEIASLLNLPLQDNGRTLPKNMLIDPISVMVGDVGSKQ